MAVPTAVPRPARDQGPDDERRVLLDAARRVMRRNDGRTALVADILAESGLKTRAFYRHFESKDDLLCAVYRRESESVARMIERQVAAAPTSLAAFEAWVDALLSIGFDPARRARAVEMVAAGMFGAKGYDEARRHQVQLHIAPLRLVLRAGLADGTFPNADPEIDAIAIHGLTWSTLDGFLSGSTKLPQAETRSYVLRFCLPALGATQ